MIDTSLFPYGGFPVRLEIKTENRVCWFKDEIDLQKYLNRYKLDKRTLKIDYRDEQPIESSKTNKKTLRQGTRKSSDGSSSTSRRSTKNVDARGNSGSTSKSKPKRKSK